ncbi:uncharacterized protein LOC111025465, partial [Momordica charantia]|uniref:Uncharacterized protein LOC111025465 n=1 Tax=Momordica charantia TaxID=3673 RepID=A0A6J1E152_MOMCH
MEIFLRLSPECLMRFTSVGKSWYDLINDLEFAVKHLMFSVQQQNLPDASPTIIFKRLVSKDSETKQNILSFLTLSNNDVDDSGSIVDIDVPFFENCVAMDFKGHSHGLVCLSQLGNTSFYWLYIFTMPVQAIFCLEQEKVCASAVVQGRQ